MDTTYIQHNTHTMFTPAYLPKSIDEKFLLEDLFPEEAEIAATDYARVFDEIDPTWMTKINQFLDSAEEVEGERCDLDDYDVYEVYPRDVFDDIDELLEDFLWERLDPYMDDNGLVSLRQIANGFLRFVHKQYEEADFDPADFGELIHKGHYKSEDYWRM